MLEHGGRLRDAAQQYDIPLNEWLDLSTGISPWCYPFTLPGVASWQRLPEVNDDLNQTASRYYGTNSLLALPGSQAAISMLPLLRTPARVLLLGPTYNEHGHAWRQAGHRVEETYQLPTPDQLARVDVLVIVNPNNPTGRVIAREQLMQWYEQLPKRSWMIIDEAFVDSRPNLSLLPAINQVENSRILVLRSLGKFFGLAGARVGFALGSRQLIQLLEQKMTSLLGAWPVSGPARNVAMQALADLPWQQQQRRRLSNSNQRLVNLLAELAHPADGQSDFFCWIKSLQARQWQQTLAEQGIWCRCFTTPDAIRLGLPANESEWRRLKQALIKLFLATDQFAGLRSSG
ncbi:MAG: threonine-phosphate decarboxylase [Gammaproteobacteria bacterium]|nr:MAG: threonine-phosphate decarboxylase [Gammaproteobacteria bacterium]RLA11860.1 MAG: threonine-phosphate decarboxylase [Gammaproteobacteria bacterium]